jgi:hypothetical protein
LDAEGEAAKLPFHPAGRTSQHKRSGSNRNFRQLRFDPNFLRAATQ